MLRLRLFQRGDLSHQLDSRTLDDGELAIGRDAKAGWSVEDPERAISRQHLLIGHRGGLLTIKDTSSNGVFLGEPRRRIERDRAVPVSRGEPIHFGNFVLVIEEEDAPAAGSPFPAAAHSGSPFGDLAQPAQDRGSGRPAQPFGSALKADPLATEGKVADADAWERRPEAEAGSWEGGRGDRRPEHTTLIGGERHWATPAPPAAAESGYGFDAPFSRPILQAPAVPPDAAAIPSDWMEAPADEAITAPPPVEEASSSPAPLPVHAPASPPTARPDAPATGGPPPAPSPPADERLFDFFCAGAGLNPAMFTGEAPERVMERLGATYRQAVLGIADLMQERTALRNEFRMVHTQVRPEGNNPFKWVPPQRIAVELLREEGAGYTTGPRALADALHDIKAHLLCMLAGMRAALATTFATLSPEQVEQRVAGRAYLMKTQRDAALWAEFVELADRLRGEAGDNVDGPINRAFRDAYEAQAAELDAGRRRG